MPQVGDPLPLYTTTLTPTAVQLEAEWRANWRDYVLVDSAPYLFSELTFGAFTNPTNVKLYVRDQVGLWSLVQEGAVTITAMDPSDGAWGAPRYFVGSGCSGFVWVSDHAGTAATSRTWAGE